MPSVRREFRRRAAVLVALGDSILGLHATSMAVTPHDGSLRGAARQLRDRRGRGSARRNPPLRHRATGEQNGRSFRIVNLVEKPSPEDAPSNLAIAGRYIFSPLIFDMIRRVRPDKRGEIQLTDAIQFLCDEGRRVMAVAPAQREALRHRQLSQLFRELCRVRAGRSGLRQ